MLFLQLHPFTSTYLTLIKDANTLNPKCVDRDSKNNCPEGQSQSSPTKNKPGTCAPDLEPDKKCDNPDLEPFKEVGPDGNMKTTCRTTRQKEEKKQLTASDKVREAGKKAIEPLAKENQARRDK
jgi:hypothetical protein